MLNYKVQEKQDISILNIKDIDKNILINIFLEKQNATIYVEEHNRIIGIITLGNLRRHILEGADLINRKFSSVMSDSREEIEKVFDKSQNIKSVPLINEKGEIEREYCRVEEKIDNYKISDEIIDEICKESKLLDASYSKLILIVENDASYLKIQENKELITVLGAKDIDKICEYLTIKDVLVMDFAYSSFYVRKIFYDKNNIQDVIGYDGSESIFLTKHISERGKLFDNIAISNRSVFLGSVFSNKRVAKIDFDKCKWNQNEECYEYVDECVGEVEAVFSLLCFTKNPWIIINNKKVPVISSKYVNLYVKNVVPVMDILSNIIPKFEKNGVKYIFLDIPDLHYDDVKDYLKENIYERRKFKEYKTSELADFIGVSEECVKNEVILSRCEVMKNGYMQLGDKQGECYNYFNGERYTLGNPDEYTNKVFLFGPCTFEGAFVTDENTIGSHLRKHIPDEYYIKNMGRRFATENFIMRRESYKKGDIAIIMVYEYKLFIKNGYQVHNFIDAFKKVDNLSEHVLDSLSHCNKEVIKHIADEIFSILKKEEVISSDTYDTSDYPVLTFGTDDKVDIPLEMQKWLDEVTKQKVANVENAGAIVMNCNPFTLGHKYLIETASSQVDVLYIFVLEEDKSFFEFKDRIELVRQGTKDLENVVVLPSGRYVISTETLPGYFEKEDNPYAEFNATDDLEIFSKVIAKEFGIRVRFAGEEPKDPFTRKYNEYMRKLLPKNGVEFVEIPRKECGNQAISASLVRKYLKENNFDEIEKLVPPTTLEYLKTNYM